MTLVDFLQIDQLRLIAVAGGAQENMFGIETAMHLTRAVQPPRQQPASLENLRMLSGTELLASLKGQAKWQRVPFLLVTARADVEHRLTALELGVDDYLQNVSAPSDTVLGQPRFECDLFGCYPGPLKTGYCGQTAAPQVWLATAAAGLVRAATLARRARRARSAS